jgi:peroxiredoxin Q/BCP
MRSILALVALVMFAASALAQEKIPQRPPQQDAPPEGAHHPSGTQPQAGKVSLGERAPDFELDGSQGRSVRLSSLRGDWIVLAFTDRARDVSSMREIEATLRTLGARIVAVCHEKPQTLTARAAVDTLGFLLLADPTGQAADAYGLYDRAYSRTIPGFLVLDRKGVLRFAALGQLPPPSEIAMLTRYMIRGK